MEGTVVGHAGIVGVSRLLAMREQRQAFNFWEPARVAETRYVFNSTSGSVDP